MHREPASSGKLLEGYICYLLARQAATCLSGEFYFYPAPQFELTVYSTALQFTFAPGTARQGVEFREFQLLFCEERSAGRRARAQPSGVANKEAIDHYCCVYFYYQDLYPRRILTSLTAGRHLISSFGLSAALFRLGLLNCISV